MWCIESIVCLWIGQRCGWSFALACIKWFIFSLFVQDMLLSRIKTGEYDTTGKVSKMVIIVSFYLGRTPSLCRTGLGCLKKLKIFSRVCSKLMQNNGSRLRRYWTTRGWGNAHLKHPWRPPRHSTCKSDCTLQYSWSWLGKGRQSQLCWRPFPDVCIELGIWSSDTNMPNYNYCYGTNYYNVPLPMIVLPTTGSVMFPQNSRKWQLLVCSTTDNSPHRWQIQIQATPTRHHHHAHLPNALPLPSPHQDHLNWL